ncbi:hypothetical protein Tco_0290930 [Tanacetum coccineum]
MVVANVGIILVRCWAKLLGIQNDIIQHRKSEQLFKMQFRIRVFRILEIRNGQDGCSNIGNWKCCCRARAEGTVKSDQGEGMPAYLQTHCELRQKEEARIQPQAEEFDFDGCLHKS